MRWIRMFSVWCSDQSSGFRDPVPNNGVPSLHLHNDGVLDVPNRDVTSWLVAACHLSPVSTVRVRREF
jgi:hypothetical protein